MQGVLIVLYIFVLINYGVLHETGQSLLCQVWKYSTSQVTTNHKHYNITQYTKHSASAFEILNRCLLKLELQLKQVLKVLNYIIHEIVVKVNTLKLFMFCDN